MATEKSHDHDVLADVKHVDEAALSDGSNQNQFLDDEFTEEEGRKIRHRVDRRLVRCAVYLLIGKR